MTVRDGWRVSAAHRVRRPVVQVVRSALGRPGSFLALALVVAATALGLIAMHSISGAEAQHDHAVAHAASTELVGPAATDAGDHAAGCEGCGHHEAMADMLCSLALIALAVAVLVRPKWSILSSRVPTTWASSPAPVLQHTVRSLQELGLSRT